MDYLKYFRNTKYDDNNNCWTFVREIYKDEHNVLLPEVPIFETPLEWTSYLQANIKHKVLETAHKGCLIHVWNKIDEHIGYATNDKEYLHKTSKGVFVSAIPKRCLIYEVINDNN